MAAKKFEDRVFELLDKAGGEIALATLERSLNVEGWREAMPTTADKAGDATTRLISSLEKHGFTVANDKVGI